MFLGLLSAWIPATFALAPAEGQFIGIEPNRIPIETLSGQRRLAAGGNWQEFTAGEGQGWTARFDEATGLPHRAMGPSIPLGPLPDARAVDRALTAFFARNSQILGVPLSSLKLRSANHVASTDTWYVDYDQVSDGVPVWRGGVTVRIRQDRLMLFGVDTYPVAPRTFSAELSEDDAIRVAGLDGPAPMADHQDIAVTRVFLPLQDGNRVSVRPAFEVHSRTSTPLGRWVTHVDAATGEILSTYNTVRFLDTTISAEHNTRTTDGNMSISVVPYAEVTGDGGSAITDASGYFSLSGDTLTTTLEGTWLLVRNDAGSEGVLTFSGNDPMWTTENATQAEIDTYIFIHQVRDWGLTHAPEVVDAIGNMRATVNANDVCNAYWNYGEVVFYNEGGGCENTGQIADIVYHEWGHGFHYNSLEGGDFDGTVSEAVGDIVAFLQTLDPVIGPGFIVRTGDGVREVESDRVYPDDLIGEVHEDGLIFGGSVWDLLGVLSETYGEDQESDKGVAWATTVQLFKDALKAGPTLDETYEEFLVADDDDADLGNGTPHLCELMEAFGQHGLGPLGEGGGVILALHEGVGNQPASTPVAITGAIENLAEQCFTTSVSDAVVVYSVDGGGSWDEAPLSVVGDDFSGEIPALPDGTIVHYYLRITSSDGDILAPGGGEIAPYSYYVGDLVEVYCESFDEDDGGYTHALLDGTEEEGADDWQYDEPGGNEGDPAAPYTGDKIWGNDAGHRNYNGAYKPDIQNRLTSIPIATQGHTELIVQFRRWLTVEDGVYDQARVYANEEEVWSNHESSRDVGDEQTVDTEWKLHTLRVATDGPELSLGWELQSDGGLEFGGWNIDDVCVYASEGPSTWFAVSDFQASDAEVGEVKLSWTQPDDSRATEAIVVRNDEEYGTSKDEGDIVFSATGLVPGAVINTGEDFVGTGYYTVFVGGADGWTSGALEGGNADMGTGLQGDVAGGADDTGEIGEIKLSGSCGCSSGGQVSWGAALLALGLLRRKRG